MVEVSSGNIGFMQLKRIFVATVRGYPEIIPGLRKRLFFGYDIWVILYCDEAVEASHLGGGHYVGISPDVHGVVSMMGVSEQMVIVEDIRIGLTVQNDVGSRDGVVGIV